MYFRLGSPAFTSPDPKSLVYRTYFPVSQRIYNKFGLMDSTHTIAHSSSTNLGVVQDFEPCIDRLDPPCQVYLWILLHFIDTLVMCVCGGAGWWVCAALHMAAANGHLDIAKLLLDHGAVSILSFLVKLDVLQSSLSFVGSALQGRDIGMHQETCQSLVSLHLGSCGVHYRNISSITEGSTWASPC